MESLEKNTEELIMDAASKVFLEKGYDGARMQEIAEVAGINKALVHYYYRSKDKLFENIFKTAFKLFAPKLQDVIETNMPLEQKLTVFAETYIDFLIKNPLLPGFILHELSRKSETIPNLLASSIIKPQAIIDSIQAEIDAGNIRPIDPKQLIANIIGLCIFPIVAKPILLVLLFNNNVEEYNNFLLARKKLVPQFIMDTIKIQ